MEQLNSTHEAMKTGMYSIEKAEKCMVDDKSITFFLGQKFDPALDSWINPYTGEALPAGNPVTDKRPISTSDQ